MAEKFYIIDGHWLAFRAYYAPFRNLTSPAGEPTKATYVFSQQIISLIRQHEPDYLAMAVDGPTEKLKRRAEFPQYKVTRKPMPEDLPPQLDRIMQVAEAFEIPILTSEGYEADDVIATLAEKYAGRDKQIIMVSRDKDLDQVVSPNISLYDPMKDQLIGPDELAEQKNYSPDKAVQVQALTGDTSDNIPGVPGIGPKTAVKLIDQYGSAEAVIEHADDLSPKLQKNILKHADDIRRAQRLITLERNVPLEVDLSQLKLRLPRPEKVRPLFVELGFNRLLKQLDEMGVTSDSENEIADAAERLDATTAEHFDYRCVNSAEALKKLAGEISSAKRLAVDTETTSKNPTRARLVGVSLAWEHGKAAYLPVKAPLGEKTLSPGQVRDAIGPILADEKITKVGQNLKYDMLVLDGAKMQLCGEMFDTMIAAHVLDATRGSYKLDSLAAEFLNHRCIPIEDLIGTGRNQILMDAVPLETVSRYAAEDADVALRLADVLDEHLRREKLDTLMAELEMPLMPVLAEMEKTGIKVDKDILSRLDEEFSARADELREMIIRSAGVRFNPDSPKQLSEILFDKLGLPVTKKTKTGASTDSGVLEELAAYHEIPQLVLDYRRLTKLIGTYLKAIVEYVNPRTGRVHTSFHQAGTATGRLSSSDPNLQNIPVRTEEGRQIRSAFVADDGCVLLSADYSQVELRMLAHFCGDETLVEAFAADRDIHRTVAAEVFGVALEEVTPQQRAKAKTVNFGIIYGQTAFGLSNTLKIPRGEARDFINEYQRRFPKIREFLNQCAATARQKGYVRTISGRRRKISGIDSSNPQRRAAAERLAINSVVQGSAADLIKRAMVNLAARLKRENSPAGMLLQIHDELLFETPEDTVEQQKDIITGEMVGAYELSVPPKVDVGIGRNWLEAK